MIVISSSGIVDGIVSSQLTKSYPSFVGLAGAVIHDPYLAVITGIFVPPLVTNVIV